MHIRFFVLILLIIPFIYSQSYGFNSKEHIEISNNAFQLSLDLLTKGELKEKESCDLKFLRSFFGEQSAHNYGTLTSIVDDMKDPLNHIKLYGSNFDKNYKFGEDHKIDSERAIKILSTTKIGWKDKLMAAKFNIDHFNGQPLTKYREFHDLAQLYASQGYLILGLVLEAFAVHYLEDFFAPGHVLTPRTEISNKTAKTLHDFNNKKGAIIDVDIEKIKPYLEQMQNGKDFESRNVSMLLALKKDCSFTFYGDDRLGKTPGQKEIIISEVAKSITEIFNAYNTHTVSNSVDSISFESDYEANKTDEKRLNMFGYSSNEEINLNFDAVKYKPITRDYNFARNGGFDYGLTSYISTPLRQSVNSRIGVEVDTSVYSPRSTGFLYKDFIVSMALGYDGTCDMFYLQNYSHGPLAKLLFDLRNTDLELCLYLKYKYNHENDKTFRSIPFGGRFIFSYDYFKLFLGLGNEPRFTDRRENVLTFNAGITFSNAVIISDKL